MKKPKTLSDEGQIYLIQNTLWETDVVHADLCLLCILFITWALTLRIGDKL